MALMNMDFIGNRVANAVTPPQMGGMVAMPSPKAQEVSGGDRFWEAFNAALPGIAAGGDALSTIGMAQGPMVMNQGVPAASPYIGPGILGLQGLIQAGNTGGGYR